MVVVDCSGDGHYTSFYCNECHSVMRFHYDCKRRVCLSCSVKRSKKLINKHKNINDAMSDGTPFFATFTLRNVKNVGKGVSRIRKAFKDLLRRHPYNVWFAGGFYAIEVSPNVDLTFNVHIHAVIDCCVDLSRGYKYELNNDWFAVTGDSYVTNWQLSRHVNDVVGYCLKYSIKEVDYPSNDVAVDVELALTGVRVLSFFGIYYNFKGVVVKRELVCVSCGSSYVSYLGEGFMFPITHSLRSVDVG